MWAIFTDPTPDRENDPGNCTWGPSSAPPFSGWKAREEWPAGLRDDLPDDWQPTPSLDVLRAAKRAKINAERDRREQGGFEYLGKILDSDPISAQRIQFAAYGADKALAAGLTFTKEWRTANNSILPLDAAGLVGMALALINHSAAQHNHADDLKARLDAAATAAEIEALPEW